MTGVSIPRLGLGTFGRTGEAGITAILAAIEIGYRHLDTAQTYDTERQVGQAVRQSGLGRDQFFVTTKVSEARLDRASFMQSVEESLTAIGIGPVDLLLIHWPSAGDKVPFESYVEALAEAQQRGFTKAIGVSNFTAAMLDRTETLLGKGAIATNQVEIHPYLQAPNLCAHAKKLGLALTAYQPLAKGRVEDDPVMQGIAARHGVTPSAISLAFLMDAGHIPIPASGNPTHLRANFAALGVQLTADDISAIRKLDRGMRLINPATLAPAWDD